MRRALTRWLFMLMLAFAAIAPPAAADHDGNPDVSGITKLFNQRNDSGAVNSDLAFWGDLAYQGYYRGVQIFDVSSPAAPVRIADFKCNGPQNDPVVWGNLLFLGVDRTQTGPNCGSTDTAAHDDPNGWEGVRIIDVRNPAAPRQVGSVYTDCGAHTITLYPKNRAEIMLYVSSYPLRPGPTCGPVNGPANGESPLHEKISVIRVPVRNPAAAKVVAEPRVRYPGDPDNRFDPDEHSLPGFNDLTACHDIGVFVELGLAAAACAEQAQLWRIKPNGVPDTERPLWVYDDNVDANGAGTPSDVVVDFWHSATFSWDGKVVNFIDESFGSGCPTVTPNVYGRGPGDTGAMFFLDTRSGRKLSHFTYPRGGEAGYCSAHLGNAVRTKDADLLVNAWYNGGIDVIDFSDPVNPTEVAFWDETSDNWSAYWYEGPTLGSGQFPVYATDGVEAPPAGEGFQVFSVLSDVDTRPLPYLNPQTQEELLGRRFPDVKRKKPRNFRSATPDGDRKGAGPSAAARRAARHLAP